jgi:hypothetical protein
MADGIAAAFHLVVWVGFVIVAAALSPPIIAAYTAIRRDRPFWNMCWHRYCSVLKLAIDAI